MCSLVSTELAWSYASPNRTNLHREELVPFTNGDKFCVNHSSHAPQPTHALKETHHTPGRI